MIGRGRPFDLGASSREDLGSVRWRALFLWVWTAACSSGTAISYDAGQDVRADGTPADVQGEASADTPPEASTDVPGEASTDAPGEASTDAPGEVSTDAPVEASTDAPGDVADGPGTPADAAGDSSGDGSSDGGAPGDGGTRSYVYLAMASTALMPSVYYPTDIVMVDVAAGSATTDTTLIGTVAMAYHGGQLLVARGAGYTRVSILNAETLAVERTQLLPWDPIAAVFSSDGRYLYASHGDGYVSQVRMADGVVTADVLVPLPAALAPGTNNGVGGLAISPSQKLLGTTTIYSGDGSGVGLISIDGEQLTLAHQWMSQPFADSNCARFAQSPAFDHANRWLVTFDQNCGAFDIYDLLAGGLTPGGSVLLANPGGSAPYVNTVEDALGRFWAIGYKLLFTVDPTAPGQHAMYPFGESVGILTNDPARALYAWRESPRLDGVFTVDPSTGTATQLPWNLDLISEQAIVAQTIWVER
jgi:hypothetical protein